MGIMPEYVSSNGSLFVDYYQTPHGVAIPPGPICATHGWLACVNMHGGLLQMKHVAAAT